MPTNHRQSLRSHGLSPDTWDEESVELDMSRACSSDVQFRRLPSRDMANPAICKNVEYLKQDDRYLSASPDDLASILSSDNLVTENEEDVYEIVQDWIYYDLEKRKEYFGMLFDTFRLSRIPKPFVDTFIKPEMLVSSNPVCYNAIARYNKLCKLYSKGLADTTEYFKLLNPPRTCNNPGNIIMLGGKDSESSWEVYNSQLNSWYKQGTAEVGRSNGNVFKLQRNLCCFIGGEDVSRKIVIHVLHTTT